MEQNNRKFLGIVQELTELGVTLFDESRARVGYLGDVYIKSGND